MAISTEAALWTNQEAAMLHEDLTGMEAILEQTTYDIREGGIDVPEAQLQIIGEPLRRLGHILVVHAAERPVIGIICLADKLAHHVFILGKKAVRVEKYYPATEMVRTRLIDPKNEERDLIPNLVY
jgi:hypothetical protein